MVSLWSLSESKSPQVSSTLLSILVNLNNAVVLMLSTRLLISKSSSPCTNPLVTVPRALIVIGITVTFMFHTLLNSLARFKYLFLFQFFLCDQLEQQSPQFGKVLFFLLIITRSGRLAEIRWSGFFFVVVVFSYHHHYYYYYYYHHHHPVFIFYLLSLLLLFI